jgi:hypothetical protein
MATNVTAALAQEMEQIAVSYRTDFAGQSRASRDLTALGLLIKRTQDVIAKIHQAPAGSDGEELSRLSALGQENLRMYEAERQAIADAKQAGPDYDEFAELAVSANLVSARYLRHFAGRDRGTRDLGLLTEMVEDLRPIKLRMGAIYAKAPIPAFQRDAEVTATSLDLYQSELQEIAKAIASGSTDDHAGRLATLANDQAALYRTHFAGQARLTRRPALLQRITNNLKRIRDAMRTIQKAKPRLDFNQKNIPIVESNIKTYETELGEIRRARQAVPLVDIMGMLGSTANDIFAEYTQKFAGKDRGIVDRDALSII